MSRKLRIIALALLAAAVVLVVSCGGPPVSISDRLNLFVVDINTNPGNAYRECDSGATLYSAAKTSTFWTNRFQFPPYTLSGLNDSNSNAVTVTFNGTGGPENFTFGMVNNKDFLSDNWMIATITDSTATKFFY